MGTRERMEWAWICFVRPRAVESWRSATHFFRAGGFGGFGAVGVVDDESCMIGSNFENHHRC